MVQLQFFIDNIAAVSYTHLDVYKRQVLYTSRNGLQQKVIEIYIYRLCIGEFCLYYSMNTVHTSRDFMHTINCYMPALLTLTVL